jgi:hydroxymethylbilane synthase
VRLDLALVTGLRRRRRVPPGGNYLTWPRCRSRPSGSRARRGAGPADRRRGGRRPAGPPGDRGRPDRVLPPSGRGGRRRAGLAGLLAARLDATARPRSPAPCGSCRPLHPRPYGSSSWPRSGGGAGRGRVRELFDSTRPPPPRSAAVAARGGQSEPRGWTGPRCGSGPAARWPGSDGLVIAALASPGSRLTRSDRHNLRPVDRRADQIGGTGVFVSALRDAPLGGGIDVACTRTGPARRRSRAGGRGRPGARDRDVLVAGTGSPWPSGWSAPSSAPGRRAGPRRSAHSASGSRSCRSAAMWTLDCARCLGRVDAVVLARPGWPAGLAGRDRDADPLMLPRRRRGRSRWSARNRRRAVTRLAALDHADPRARLAERAPLAAWRRGCCPVGARAVLAEGEHGPGCSSAARRPRLTAPMPSGCRPRRSPTPRRSAGGWRRPTTRRRRHESRWEHDELRAQDHRSGHVRGAVRRPRPAHRPPLRRCARRR